VKINLAILGTLLAIGGLIWQGSAKLTRMELALEGVPELRAELKQVREDLIVLKSHWRSQYDEARTVSKAKSRKK
jgi:uncharacterized membrane protein YfbV (UPF0208 family)